MKTPHPQATELMAMAQDMNTHIQIEVPSMDTWANCTTREALQAIASGVHRIRIKPAPTIMIGDVEVPEPMRVAPEIGTGYWLVSLEDGSITEQTWFEESADMQRMSHGVTQATEQGA